MHAHSRPALLATLLVSTFAATVYAQRPEVKISTQHVAGTVHLLSGAGGNIAVCAGEDGVLLVDSGYGMLLDKITAALRELTPDPVRIVVNTHWHFDHVGGNEGLAKAGAVIIAHDNVRRCMGEPRVLAHIDRAMPSASGPAMPVVTYADTLTLHLNGEEIELIHLPPAHTDGDTLVRFRAANVLHLGDTCFNGMYPYIDVNAGGSLAGMVAALDQALSLADEQTKIIPGHGLLADRRALKTYRDMLATVRNRVHELKAAGKSRAEVIAARVTAEFDATFGSGGFQPDQWVGMVYDGAKP